jgi:hypothetical protein
LNFQPISNIEIFPTYTELELDVLGVTGNLVKNVVHLWKQNFEKLNFSLPTGYPNSNRPLLDFKEF